MTPISLICKGAQLHVKDTLPVYIVIVIDNQGPRAWLPGFATLEQCTEKISLKFNRYILAVC